MTNYAGAASCIKNHPHEIMFKAAAVTGALSRTPDIFQYPYYLLIDTKINEAEMIFVLFCTFLFFFCLAYISFALTYRRIRLVC